MRLKKNDNVTLLVGKDQGKTGKLLRVDIKKNIVFMEGIMQKRHRRPRKQGEKGEVVSVPRPVSISNVAFICPNCDKITRLGARFEGGKKVRYCKKCNGAV